MLCYCYVCVDGSDVLFCFCGKSGVQYDIKLYDFYVVCIICKMCELLGQELFQYVDDEGECYCIDLGDVNVYLCEVVGEDFSVKDFCIWVGMVLVMLVLQVFECVDLQVQVKQNVVCVIENVVWCLGNMFFICCKCYVYFVVIESYLDGSFVEWLEEWVQVELVEELQDLLLEEVVVLVLL